MRKKNQQSENRQYGFTLVELLIAMALASFLMAGVAALITTAGKTYSGENIKTSVRQDARAAFDIIVTELTMAGFNPTQSANFTAFSVSSPSVINPVIQSSQIRIFMDLPSNPNDLSTADGNITAGSDEDITYGLSGTNLQRNGQTVIPNVTALGFIYRDGSGNVTAVAGDIREIDVSMTVQASNPDPRTGNTRSITLTSIIFPRNLLYAGN